MLYINIEAREAEPLYMQEPNPTQPTTSNLVEYGVKLSSFLVSVGQKA
jgi:hypothetical protein